MSEERAGDITLSSLRNIAALPRPPLPQFYQNFAHAFPLAPGPQPVSPPVSKQDMQNFLITESGFHIRSRNIDFSVLKVPTILKLNGLSHGSIHLLKCIYRSVLGAKAAPVSPSSEGKRAGSRSNLVTSLSRPKICNRASREWLWRFINGHGGRRLSHLFAALGPIAHAYAIARALTHTEVKSPSLGIPLLMSPSALNVRISVRNTVPVMYTRPSLIPPSTPMGSENSAHAYTVFHDALLRNPSFIQSRSCFEILPDSIAAPIFSCLGYRIRKVLSDSTCPATFVDISRGHASLAVWYLTRTSIQCDALDIFFASDFGSCMQCAAVASYLGRSPAFPAG
ncbi:hypothetical protein B0H14DRAFT_2578549 [Mycena olivaceomarginata]|nr:hypothetical protein B0H14DRAFT_2578549 [Mycena olivaceomarginata]